MTWYYDDRYFTENDVPDDVVGFVYIIERIDNGRKYVGKKNLHRVVTRPPLKGKRRRRRSKKSSDWQDYYGSNDELLADVKNLGVDKFRREIVRLCRTKGEMSYHEARLQFDMGVLLSPERYYNSWIRVRVTRAHMRAALNAHQL